MPQAVHSGADLESAIETCYKVIIVMLIKVPF